MKNLFTYLKALWGAWGNLQSKDVRHDRRRSDLRRSPSGLESSALLKFVSVLVLIQTVGVGQMWGTTYTTGTIPTGWSASGGSMTMNTISWTYSSATYLGVTSGKIQVGSSKKPQTSNWTIQTAISNFGSGKKVTAISITAYTTATSATYDISAGGSTVKSGSLSTSSSTYTASSLNVSSGDIVITMKGSSSSKAMYLSAISVTYEDAASCTTPPTVGASGNSSISVTGATVSCTGITKGDCDIDEWGFFYKTGSSGVTTSDTKVQVSAAKSTTNVSSFNKSFTELNPNTHYYFKAYAKVGSNYYLSSETDFTTKTLTSTSSNTTYGTVSRTGRVITGSLKAGGVYGSPAYTVTGASDGSTTTVDRVGNTFTVTSNSTSNITVTINFESKGCTDHGASSITSSASTSYTTGPVDEFYKYSTRQILYTKSDLGLDAGKKGTIKSIYFKYAGSSAMTKKTSVDIYLANTSLTALASGTAVPYSAFTKVYSGPLNFTAAGWQEFLFNIADFDYDGVGCLAVMIDDNSFDYDGTAFTFNVNSSSGAQIYKHSDTTNEDPSTINWSSDVTATSERPNAKFCIQEADMVQSTVTWVAGSNPSFGSQTDYEGTALSDPGTPSAASYCPGGKVFVGWTATPIVGEGSAPADLFTSVSGKSIPSGGTTYYAVFATVSESTTKFKRMADLSELNNASKIAFINSYSSSRYILNTSLGVAATTPTESDGEITVSDGQYWTLESSNSNWKFKTGTDYLVASTIPTSGSKTGAVSKAASGNTEWVITSNTYTSNGTPVFTIYNAASSTAGLEYNSGWLVYYGTDFNTSWYTIRIYVPKKTYSAYATTCCTPLGSINGSVSWSNAATAVVSWDDLAHVSSWTVKYKTHAAGEWSTAGASSASAGTRSVTISSLTPCTNYDFKIIATPDDGYCDKDQTIEDSQTHNWTVTSTGVTNVTPASAIPSTTCTGFSIASMTPASGYHLPATITVDNADHTWNSSTGALTISNVTGNVTITIEGEENGCSDYSFHSGGSDVWNTRAENKCFSLVSGTLWSVDYTIASYTHYCVNYQGGKYSTGGSHSVSFATVAWADMKFWERSFAVGVATGAKGKLKVYSDSYTTNLGVGFEPDGYGITYGGTGHEFATTGTANMLETEVVELPNVGSTTYTMGLATATAGTYVTCAHSSAAENINVMGMSSVEGGLRKIWLYSTAANWIGGNAKMAIWDATNSHWGNNTSDTKFMTKVNDNLWYGYVPTSATSIILVRVNPANADPAWDWGQSYDVTPSDVNNYITITGTWSNDAGDNNKSKAEYTIGSMHPTTGMNGKFRMWDNSGDNNWHVHFVPYYKLTYNANGGSNAPATAYGNSESANNVTVNNGSGLTAPDGKHFVKWNTANDGSGEDVAAGSFTLTEDLELFAIYDWDNYTVTVNKSGCASATVGADKATAHYGETVTLSADEPSGYAFVNWTTSDGVTFSPNASTKGATFTMPTSNVTVQANYHQIYTITWSVNGSALTGDALDGADVSVEQGSNLANVPSTDPADNSLNNCANKFMGWSKHSWGSTAKGTGTGEYDDLFKTASEFVDAGGSITGNTTFYAVFAEEVNSGTYSDGTTHQWLGSSGYSDWGGSATYSWLRNNNAVIPTHYYTPAYGVKKVVLNVKQSNTTGSNTVAVTIGGTTVGTTQGMGSGTSAFDMTFDHGTGTPLTGEVRIVATNTSANTTGQGTFYLNSITLYEGTPDKEFVNYVTECAANQVRVSYNFNGGYGSACTEGVTTKTASYTVCSTTPTKNFYDFTGWNDGTSTYAAGTTGYNLQANTTFTAQWTPTTYNITYELDGGTNDGDNPATYNVTTETITLKAPTRDHDRFEGWFTDDGVWSDEVTEIPLGSHGDITLYAKWTERHEIVFDYSEGDGGTTTTIYRADDEDLSASVAGQGSVPSDPSAPTACSSKVFVGWSESTIDGETDTEPGDLMKPAAGTVDEDKEFHAVWAIESSSTGPVTVFEDALYGKAADGSTFSTYGEWDSFGYVYGCGTSTEGVRVSSKDNGGHLQLKANIGLASVDTIKFKIKSYGDTNGGKITLSSYSGAGTYDNSTSAEFTTTNTSSWEEKTCILRSADNTTDIRFEGEGSKYRIYLKDIKITKAGTVYTYSAYSTSCCATKVTLSKNTPEHGTIAFGKTKVSTCGGDKEVSLTITPEAGYQLHSYDVATGVGKVATKSVSPDISLDNNSSAVQNITLTFASGANGAYDVTASFTEMIVTSWTWTMHDGGGAIPDPLNLYIGQSARLDVAYTPSTVVSGKKTYTRDKDNTYINWVGGLQSGYSTISGKASTGENTTAVTFTHADGPTKTVNVKVLPLPLTHFVDLVHGKPFADVAATIVDNALSATKSTPTSDDWVTPNANSCEENHLHLVGWIREDWPALVAYLNGTGDAPTTTAIVGAGNDGEGHAYFFAPNASINVQTFNGVTFYAVWSKVE